MDDVKLEEIIESVFKKYDVDHSGKLDIVELSGFLNETLAKMGSPIRVNEEESKDILAIIDTNKDGKASQIELFNCFKQILCPKTN